MSSNRTEPRRSKKKSLARKYPPSLPCSCEICAGYCERPGWWTVEEASRAIDAGYGSRMMLEVSPEMTFGVLSPAFKGCEAGVALQRFADRRCTFLTEAGCELHGSGFQPLECRFCHHDRKGRGKQCHADLELDWHTPAGRSLMTRWLERFGKPAAEDTGSP